MSRHLNSRALQRMVQMDFIPSKIFCNLIKYQKLNALAALTIPQQFTASVRENNRRSLQRVIDA
jgi:hypothetical protein